MAYVCEICAAQYELETAITSCHGSCEICGPLDGDWTQRFVIWAPQIHRYFCMSDADRKAEVEADLLWVDLKNEEEKSDYV